MATEVIVSYLPLSHVAATALDIFAALSLAATVYFADKDALKGTLPKTIADVRPTIFLGVPRVYEKFHEKLVSVGSQAGIIKKSLSSWAKSVALEHHMNKRAGQESTSLQYRLASTLVLSKIKQALGFDRLKVMATGTINFNFFFKLI
jgi:long-chain-fatty-acid--CoA ligase ACSBG